MSDAADRSRKRATGLSGYIVVTSGGANDSPPLVKSPVPMSDAAPLTAEQWLRITQVHELVKQEGDATCEAAFDDLILEVLRLRERAADATERAARIADDNGQHAIAAAIRAAK